MKSLIPTIAVLVVLARFAAAQDNPSQKFYEKMASNTFAIIAEIGDTDLPTQKIKSFFHNGATSAFSYWINTRKGRVLPSKSVDAAIAMFYEEATRKKLTSVFSDPLLRKNAPEPERIGVVGFSKMTQIEYEGYVIEFQKYLHEVLQARVLRFKKHEAEQDAAANP